jgi:hypothetical protein
LSRFGTGVGCGGCRTPEAYVELAAEEPCVEDTAELLEPSPKSAVSMESYDACEIRVSIAPVGDTPASYCENFEVRKHTGYTPNKKVVEVSTSF